MRYSLSQSKGFTLIELAITMVIIGLMLSGVLVSYAKIAENTRIKTAESEIDTALIALMGYALVNGYLPCPDINSDGWEDRDEEGQCSDDDHAQGDLPYVDLGLSANDPWNNPYIYAVGNDYSKNTGFDLKTTDGLSVHDQIPAIRANSIARNVVAVVLSYGPGGRSKISASEEENTNNDNERYISQPFQAYVDGGDNGTNDDDTGFDHIVKWLSPHVLKARMVEARRLFF